MIIYLLVAAFGDESVQSRRAELGHDVKMRLCEAHTKVTDHVGVVKFGE